MLRRRMQNPVAMGASSPSRRCPARDSDRPRLFGGEGRSVFWQILLYQFPSSSRRCSVAARASGTAHPRCKPRPRPHPCCASTKRSSTRPISKALPRASEHARGAARFGRIEIGQRDGCTTCWQRFFAVSQTSRAPARRRHHKHYCSSPAATKANIVRNSSQRLRMRKANSPNMLTIRAIRLIMSAADTQVAVPAPVV